MKLETYYIIFPIISQLSDYYVKARCSSYAECKKLAKKYFPSYLNILSAEIWNGFAKPLANKLLCELEEE